MRFLPTLRAASVGLLLGACQSDHPTQTTPATAPGEPATPDASGARSVTAHQAQTAHAQGGRTSVTLLHAWCDEAGLCLGQYETDHKVNEPRVLPDLLALLDVRGCVVSADAGFTQPSTAAVLVQAGADYVLALKRRQMQLYAATQAAFAQAPDADRWEAPAEKPRHARHETRRCRVVAGRRVARGPVGPVAAAPCRGGGANHAHADPAHAPRADGH